MKQQIIVIHGGDTFDSAKKYLAYLKEKKVDWEQMKAKKWKEDLSQKLGRNFEVIAPKMPNSNNSKYLEWKIWFEKLIPFFHKEVILLGHSLGGIFLAKYLSANKFSKKIRGVFLVAPPFDAKNSDYSLADFTLPKKLTKLAKQGGQIFLYHSQDDPVVSFVDLAKYQKQLPSAKVRIFTNRQHFNQDKFPEIVRDIKNLF
ncbi:MAG: alpha/beta hydrolase [Patescibacteria group bacterium]